MSSGISTLRNVALLSAASYLELAFSLILGVVIARSLGSAEFGHYAFAVWASGTLITLCNNALTMSSIKFVAEARGAGQGEVAAALHHRLHQWQTISSLVVLGAFAIGAIIHPPSEWQDTISIVLPLLLIGAWGRSGYTMMAALGKGYERFEITGIASLASVLANLLLVTALAYVGGTMLDFFAVYAVCGLLQNLSARILLRRFGIHPKPLLLSKHLTQRLHRHLLQTGVLVLLATVADRTFEILLLRKFWTPEAVGYFAIAGSLTKGATYLLAGALSSVLLPTMSRAFGSGGTTAVVRMLHASIRYYWFIGVMIAGLGVIMAPGAVRLFYGPQFEAAIPAVVVNLAISGFVLVSAALNAFHASSDHQGDRIKISGIALLVNLISSFALVPAFGLTGALASLAITNMVSVYISWTFVRRAEGFELPTGAMLRVLLAALAAVAVALICNLLMPGRFTFIPAGLLFVGAYLAGSAVLRAWTRTDFETIAEVARRLGPGGNAMVPLIEAAADRFAA